MNMEERPSQVIEEYLLVFYKPRRDGEKAKSVTLANSLGTSAPTIHATVARMQRYRLIKVNRSKEIQLTPSGLKWQKTSPTAIILPKIFSATPSASPGLKCINMQTNWNMQ